MAYMAEANGAKRSKLDEDSRLSCGSTGSPTSGNESYQDVDYRRKGNATNMKHELCSGKEETSHESFNLSTSFEPSTIVCSMLYQYHAQMNSISEKTSRPASNYLKRSNVGVVNNDRYFVEHSKQEGFYANGWNEYSGENHTSQPQSQQNWNNIDNEDGGGRRKREESERVNHILLFTILNPMYPITTDVIHTISNPHGQVLRIVVFKKHGVQAMVEFDSVEAAKRAKEGLHGADIYSGCCTLKIDFAKPSKLNVYKNDSESWDYTNPNLGTSKEGRPGPLLQEPRFGTAPIPYRGNGIGTLDPVRSQVPFANGPYDRYENGYSRGMNGPTVPGGGPPYHDQPAYDRYSCDRSYMGGVPKEEYPYRNGPMRSSPPNNGELVPTSGSATGPARPMQQGAVMMVYGLCKDKINSERLFNLFCLYGNVVRVKFLKSKEGCAMVQMGDAISVERAMSNFNNTFMFGSKVQLGYSKQAFLSDVQQPHTLPDGSPSFKDFMGSKNNRFLNPEMASKNRIQPPTKTLHFFNTPPNIAENEMRDVFTDAKAPRPKAIKFFQSKGERSSSGLIEFETVTEAVEALSIMNHYPIKSSGGKFPFVMKLCFSSSRNPTNRIEEK